MGGEGYGRGNGFLEWRGGWRSDEVKENRGKDIGRPCVTVISKHKYLLFRVNTYRTL